TYAGLSERVEEFATLYGSLKQNLSKLNKLKEEERKNAQLRELYEFQYEELTQAKLNLTEDSKLQQ
ncbi:MAG: DNA repair protein RecN, partial [Candidatus Cloacimonetes bacterium]|nr:DNA repair protein RecN [Candidatus Cloacimonadota bacterium]